MEAGVVRGEREGTGHRSLRDHQILLGATECVLCQDIQGIVEREEERG